MAPGLDWGPGDKIGFFPTSIHFDEDDFAIIVSYDSASGNVTLDRPLNYYHFGAPTSTGSLYNGVDIRGEVVLLSRNVRIVGNDTEAWGGQFVTSGFIEANNV